MNVLMLLFSLFSSLLNNNFINEEVNMECTYQIIDEEKYVYGNYEVIKRDDKLEILYNNVRLRLINNVFHYKVILEDDNLNIFLLTSNNDYLHIYNFKKGNYNYYKLINNKFINKFDIIKYNENYLFVSTIDQYENNIIINKYNSKDYLFKNNGIIILFDKNFNIINCEIYGGELNDCFENIYFDSYDETIYITGWKDQNSGYDFGNGGNGVIGYILLKIDEKLNIINYLVFNNNIVNVQIYDRNINLFTNLDLFVLDNDLNKLSSLKFDYHCIFGKQISKYWVAYFNQTELKIYDIVKNKCINTLPYLFSDSINEIIVEDYYLYLKDKNNIYKCLFYNNLYSDRLFIYDDFDIKDINNYIIGIPCNYNLIDISYEEGYSPVIFGKYKVYFDFEYFIIESQIEVLERVNVTDQYVYPNNYNLLFSGEGYLNGELIENNHLITEEGEHSLLLKGKDEEKVINFYVYNMDIYYIEQDLKDWDYETRINQELQFEFHYSEDVLIKDVIVNNESYEFINDEDNNILFLTFMQNKEGLYKYLINKIIYEKNNKEYENNINYNFKLNVISEKISLNNNYYNDDKNIILNCNVINNNDKIRYLKVLFSDDSYQIIPLKAGNIIINSNKLDLVTFYIVYDVNGILLEEKELFEMEYNFNNDSIGYLELVMDNDLLQEINLKITKNNNLSFITVDNKTAYCFENNYILPIMIVGLIILVSFASFIIIKVIKKKKY